MFITREIINDIAKSVVATCVAYSTREYMIEHTEYEDGDRVPKIVSGAVGSIAAHNASPFTMKLVNKLCDRFDILVEDDKEPEE